jgi:hypothetical protein
MLGDAGFTVLCNILLSNIRNLYRMMNILWMTPNKYCSSEYDKEFCNGESKLKCCRKSERR